MNTAFFEGTMNTEVFFWVQWTLGWCFNGSSPTKNPAFLLKQVGRTQAFLLTLFGTWAAICPQHNLHRIGPRADTELLGLTILSFFILFIFRFFKNIYHNFFLQIWPPIASSTGGEGIPPNEPGIRGTVAILSLVHPAKCLLTWTAHFLKKL